MTDSENHLWEMIEEALKSLEWKDQVILNLRYFVDPPISFRRIGYLLNIGSVRTAQIEKEIIKRLRKQIMFNGHRSNLEEMGIYMEKGFQANDYTFFDKSELTRIERKRIRAGYRFDSENYLTSDTE